MEAATMSLSTAIANGGELKTALSWHLFHVNVYLCESVICEKQKWVIVVAIS